MVDLITRLRGNGGAVDIPEIMHEAAAEIERLRQWVEDHPYSELDMDMHVEAVTKDLRAALESLTKDPPATLSREPDTDAEVIIKMRAIAREAIAKATAAGGGT